MINLKDNIMKRYLFLITSIVLFSCQNKESKSSLVPSENKVVAKQTNSINEQVGDTIEMNYKDKNGLYTAEGLLDTIWTKVYVKFKSETAFQDQIQNFKVKFTIGKIEAISNARYAIIVELFLKYNSN